MNSFNKNLANTSISKNIQFHGKLNSYLERYNVYSYLSLSKEEELFYKNMLKDDKLTMNELISLSYKEVKIIASLIIGISIPKNNVVLHEMPLINLEFNNQMYDMLLTTITTNDEKFNQAIYNTLKNMSSNTKRSSFLKQLHSNIYQLHNCFDKSTMKIDFDIFLKKIISKTLTLINNSKNIENTFCELYNDYVNLEKHYNKVKK